jgi:hypothetical protein
MHICPIYEILKGLLPDVILTEKRIVPARGIKGVEKNGNSDGMVELWIGNDKKNPLKTKVYDDTLTPQVRPRIQKSAFLEMMFRASEPSAFQAPECFDTPLLHLH